jgi:hypothetical protein
MSCGVHVAHRGQLLRSLHPPVRKPDGASKLRADLRGGDDDRRPVHAVADTAILFTVSYFSTAFFLALGADELVLSGLTTIVLIFNRYLHVVNRAAYGVAGRLLGVLGALRGLLYHRPGPAADHPGAGPAPAGMDRDNYRDYYWNGHWLPF